MEIPRDPDRDACVREEVYARMNLSESIVREIERMVETSPDRKIGKGARDNIITYRHSHKSSRVLYPESHTCEALFHNLCDLDPDIVAYYSQVRLCRVIRPRGIGIHVSSAHIDVLVFYADAIKIVECKYVDELERLIARQHKDWHQDGDQYVNQAYRNWADERGLLFEVYSPPFPFARYQSNLSTLQAAISDDVNEDDKIIIKALVEMCAGRGPQTAAAACSCVPGSTRRHVMHALISRSLIGTLHSELLESDRFLIGVPGSDIENIDIARHREIAILGKNPVIRDEFLTHPKKHREFASRRLNRILAMRQNEMPWTRNYKTISDDFIACSASLEEMLRRLLPNFKNCGNRSARTTPEQARLLTEYLQLWTRGSFAAKKIAFADYLNKSKDQGTPSLSRTTFYSTLKSADPARVAQATEGIRSYQHTKKRSPPLARSAPAQLSGHTVHIDATSLDVRAGALRHFGIPAQRAIIYVARDVRGKPLSRSFILGHARTVGVAILWRLYVYRHGELPHLVHQDRGSENESKWHREFATGRFQLRDQQTGNARANQPAEDLLNHINSRVSHWLAGNTLPDRKGRAVDGKFKSITTARLGLRLICQFVDEYLFEDHAWIRNVDGLTIDEDYQRRRTMFGMGGGKPCRYDDEFLISTSVPLIKYKYSEKDGVRTTDGYYLNDEMQTLFRNRRPDRVLSDCIDPSTLYVQIRDRWFRALRADVWGVQDASPDERLIYLLTERASTSIRRKEREEDATMRYLWFKSESQRALNATPASVAPSVKSDDSSELLLQDDVLDEIRPFGGIRDDDL